MSFQHTNTSHTHPDLMQHHCPSPLNSDRHTGFGLFATRWSAPTRALGGSVYPAAIMRADVAQRTHQDTKQIQCALEYQPREAISRKGADSDCEVRTQ